MLILNSIYKNVTNILILYKCWRNVRSPSRMSDALQCISACAFLLDNLSQHILHVPQAVMTIS